MKAAPFEFNCRPSSGFTLVELMIALAIIAILAAIAVPMYSKQVQKSRRVDARTAVTDLAGREERYLSSNGIYATTWALLGYTGAGNTTAAMTVGSGYYQLSATTTAGVAATNTPPSYLVVATVIAGSPQVKDLQCQYFSMDSTGKQFSSATNAGGTDTSSTCWQ
jgi:type IV pilus assembly protein PilE